MRLHFKADGVTDADVTKMKELASSGRCNFYRLHGCFTPETVYELEGRPIAVWATYFAISKLDPRFERVQP